MHACFAQMFMPALGGLCYFARVGTLAHKETLINLATMLLLQYGAKKVDALKVMHEDLRKGYFILWCGFACVFVRHACYTGCGNMG